MFRIYIQFVPRIIWFAGRIVARLLNGMSVALPMRVLLHCPHNSSCNHSSFLGRACNPWYWLVKGTDWWKIWIRKSRFCLFFWCFKSAHGRSGQCHRPCHVKSKTKRTCGQKSKEPPWWVTSLSVWLYTRPDAAKHVRGKQNVGQETLACTRKTWAARQR